MEETSQHQTDRSKFSHSTGYSHIAVIAVIFAVMVAVGGHLLANRNAKTTSQSSQKVLSPTSPTASPAHPTQLDTQDSTYQAIEVAALSALTSKKSSSVWFYDVDSIKISLDRRWATVTAVQKLRTSGELIITEPIFMLAKWSANDWDVAFPNEPVFPLWLPQVPTSLISEQDRRSLELYYNF